MEKEEAIAGKTAQNLKSASSAASLTQGKDGDAALKRY